MAEDARHHEEEYIGNCFRRGSGKSAQWPDCIATEHRSWLSECPTREITVG
jgi:hypothetical protein